MKQFKTYIEEVQSLRSGIEHIESALRTLYNLQENITEGNKRAINRKITHINQVLLKATSNFNLKEYNGNSLGGSLKDNIDSSINLLSKILNDYDEGSDDPLTWGKTCKDIIVSLTNKNRIRNK